MFIFSWHFDHGEIFAGSDYTEQHAQRIHAHVG